MKNYFPRVLILVLLFGAFWSQKAFPCSSCGSGAVDPIILFPNENQKVYFGLGHRYRIRDISAQGQVRSTSGIESQNTAVVSYALRIKDWPLSVSLTTGYSSNLSSDRSKAGFSDPLLALRYNLLQQTFTNPFKPQLQLLVSHKWPGHDSIHNARDQELLDVFSNGYRESSLGGDLWFGMWPIKFGASVLYTYTHPTSKNATDLKPGDRITNILTVGYVYDNWLKMIGGTIFSNTAPLEDSGEDVEDSTKKDRSWYVTWETLGLPYGNLRLTLTQRVNWSSQNSTSFNSVTLAYMQGWL